MELRELSTGLATQSSFSICLGHGPYDDLRWTNAQIEDIRAKLIQHNFTSALPRVWLLGRVEVVQDVRSQLQVLRSSVGNTSLAEWLITALAVGMVTAGVALVGLGVYYGIPFLKERYIGLTLGTARWIDTHTRVPISLYNKEDFFWECAQLIGGIAAGVLVLGVGVFTLLSENPSFFSVYMKESLPYKAVQQVNLEDSSMTGFPLENLSNALEEEGWADPIEQETIPRDKISSPPVFRIDRYAICLLPLLMCVFQSNFQSGQVPHPAQQDCMGSDIEQKFVTDITRFFSITSENFFQCSKVFLWIKGPTDVVPVPTTEAEVVARDGRLNSEGTAWFRLARKVAFLKLLPPEIVDQYFRGFLLEPERKVARELLQNPRFLNYSAIFTGTRFNKYLFAN